MLSLTDYNDLLSPNNFKDNDKIILNYFLYQTWNKDGWNNQNYVPTIRNAF